MLCLLHSPARSRFPSMSARELRPTYSDGVFMKILITGNMGYVGPVVLHRLREFHPRATLIGYDAGYFAHCLTGAPRLPETRADAQYFGDIRRVPEDVLEGVDSVVHLCAISNDPMGAAFEEVTLDINYRASIALAQKAKNRGVER